MSYEYLDHQADVGIKGVAGSPAEAIEEVARGMFNVMAQIEKIKKSESCKIEVESTDLESCLVETLNELLFQREVKGLILGDLKVEKLEKSGKGYHLMGTAFGEEIGDYEGELKIEVKAATYAGLKYYQEDGKHIFQCVLDI